MATGDLLVTVEGRNLYQRVVGRLPRCPKLAITSDAAKARKNEYLASGDLVIEGDPVTVLRLLTERLGEARVRPGLPAWDDAVTRAAGDGTLGSGIAGANFSNESSRSDPSEQLRTGVVAVLAEALDAVQAPVLVDDSQMFGGLVCRGYDRFPAKLRVFGDHCGFVGSGISHAPVLAISDPSKRGFCLLRYHSSTN